MDVIVRGRQWGKTTDLITRAAEDGSYIVCSDLNRVLAVWAMARERDLLHKVRFPLTWSEFTQGRYQGRNIKGFLIDDLDDCLQSMTDVPIKAVTLSGVSG